MLRGLVGSEMCIRDRYNLATFYIEGKVVLQDYEKAVYWFEKAAIQ